MDEPEEWMTIREAAEDRGVHWVSIRAAIKRGALRGGVGMVPGRGEMMMVAKSDVMKWRRSGRGRRSKPKEKP